MSSDTITKCKPLIQTIVFGDPLVKNSAPVLLFSLDTPNNTIIEMAKNNKVMMESL